MYDAKQAKLSGGASSVLLLLSFGGASSSWRDSDPLRVGVDCALNNRGGNNPRSANGNRRRKHRARFKAMNAPCGICGGRLGPIHYDEPSDAQHPLSFVIDEVIPISKYKQGGYESPEGAAGDWNNLQAAHWICNSRKGAKTGADLQRTITRTTYRPDGDW